MGNLTALVAVLAVWRPDGTPGNMPVHATAVSAVALWSVYGGVLWMVTRGLGSGSWRHDYGLAFRTRDVPAGLALGLAGQFLLAPAVNALMSGLFPGHFEPEEVERRAREMATSAEGVWIPVLIILVVLAAPLVEELLYRGFLQQGLANSFGSLGAWLVTAVVFAAVHLEPVEFPGLLAFALLLGWLYRRTGRIGTCVATHMAFNAAGLGSVWLIS